MSTWLSVLLLGSLLAFSAALPRGSKNGAKEVERLLARLLDKHAASNKDSRQPTVEEINIKSNLYGVAYLGSRLYVIDEDSSDIQVFDADTLSKVETIVVSGLRRPLDLTACESSKLLFVVDGHPQNYIYQVDPATKQSTIIDVADTRVNAAGTVSCYSGDLVATSVANSVVFVYNVASKNVRKIELPSTIVARHAVLTNDGTLYVSHIAARGRSNDDAVSKFTVSANSEVTLAGKYGGNRGSGNNQLNKPTHLALLKDGRVLVGDLQNKRVVAISADLSSGDIFVSTTDLLSRNVLADDGSTDGLPYRLSVKSDGSELCVGEANGEIQIYTL